MDGQTDMAKLTGAILQCLVAMRQRRKTSIIKTSKLLWNIFSISSNFQVYL
jgi:hypothetical protein